MLKRMIAATALLTTIAGEASAGKLFCEFSGYTVEIGVQPATFKVCNGSDCKTVPVKWSNEPPGGGKGSVLASHYAELDDKHYIATLVVRDGPDDVHTEFTSLHGREFFAPSVLCEGEIVPATSASKSALGGDPKKAALLQCSTGGTLPGDYAIQFEPGEPIGTGLMGERKVPDTGVAVIDLGDGVSLLREGTHARLITPLYSTVTCHTRTGFNFRAVGGSWPLSDPGIDVQDAYARAEAYKKSLDKQVREADERKEARNNVLNAQMSANTKCTFADGSTIEGGIFHTPGRADTRARFYAIGGKIPEINYFGGGGLGKIDHRTGEASYNAYADERTIRKEKHVLGSCTGVPTPEPDPD